MIEYPNAGDEGYLVILIMNSETVYHVSEEGGIMEFHPRPSPSFYSAIDRNVVFAISRRMLHNYLLPRDCPRVTWYAGETSDADKNRFSANKGSYVICVDGTWLHKIQSTPLFLYEFNNGNFQLLDECAGYYISYQTERPLAVTRIENALKELAEDPAIEIQIVSDLRAIEARVKASSLRYSMIRMRNAAKPSIDDARVAKERFTNPDHEN